MAEVALAVMLVIGAGLMIRTVYNLATVDAGFDRVAAGDVPDVAGDRRLSAARRRARSCISGCSRSCAASPASRRASAMSGLPPNRPLNANDTDIGNYTAPPEGPFENVDYYQSVMTDYFETMGIPIVQGRSFLPSDAASGSGGDRQRNAGQHVLEGSESDRPDAEARLRALRATCPTSA